MPRAVLTKGSLRSDRYKVSRRMLLKQAVFEMRLKGSRTIRLF